MIAAAQSPVGDTAFPSSAIGKYETPQLRFDFSRSAIFHEPPSNVAALPLRNSSLTGSRFAYPFLMNSLRYSAALTLASEFTYPSALDPSSLTNCAPASVKNEPSA